MLDEHIERITRELLGRIEATTREPVALEALWDGDTSGWSLGLSVIVREQRGSGGHQYQDKFLMTLRFGSDIRLFTGSVPPWPEAVVAQRVGRAVAEQLGIPFWFPSPDEPDDDCPHWWEQDKAHPCKDCAKPILPNRSPYLPQDVCYRCHLRREQQAKLRKDAPRRTHNRGVYCVAHKDGEPLGYQFFRNWSDVEDLLELTTKLGRPIEPLRDVTLTPGEMKALRVLVEQHLEALLSDYSPPDAKWRRHTQREMTILGRTLLLDFFYSEHSLIAQLHDFLLTLERCTGDEVLSFFVNAGIGHRELEVLLFLQRQGDGGVDLATLSQHLQVLGGPEDFQELVRNLEMRGCVSIRGDAVSLTLKGKLIDIAEG